MNRKTQQIKRAKKSGLTNVDIAYIKELAKRESEKMEVQAVEQAFKMMLTIPCVILIEDYWQKTADKRIPEISKKMYKLYQDWVSNDISTEEMQESLKAYGVDVDKMWEEFAAEREALYGRT